jgi:predicted Rossmann fold nucleotide-binding protein DprA/Smf involved in DNA uptake
MAARGLARGIDARARKGALSSAVGAAVGVLGCGIDFVHPKGNKKLFAEIEPRGQLSASSRSGRFPHPRISRFRNESWPEWLLGL